MLDLKIYTRPPSRPSPTHKPDVVAAKRRLDTFVATVKTALSRARPVTAANSVVVQPGGRSFSTIGAALASITDASEQRQYVVSIGAGTYAEVVTCKPWVFLTGAGTGQTIITAASQPTPAAMGTVKGASHSAVQNCTVQATTSGTFGDFTTAVNCQGAVDFDIENCELTAVDATNMTNVTGLALDWYTDSSGSQVNISYTMVTANGGAMPLAINVYYAAYAHGMESRFIAENGQNPGWGGAAADASTLLVENCYVQGAAYSLITDGNPNTHITANQCQLNGPVGPGVVVNK